MDTPNYSDIDDNWDKPFTEEELQEIEAALQSATTKRAHNSGDESHRKSRRRLPESLFIFNNQQNEGSNTSSFSPCTTSRFQRNRAKLVMRYPEITFNGRVIYSRTTKEVEKSAAELFNFVEEKKRKEGQVALGFDIEWKPTFRRGHFNAIQLIVSLLSELANNN